MAGSGFGNQFTRPIGPSDPTAMFGNPASFSAAAKTQAGDYDSIMKQYQDLAKNLYNNPMNSRDVNPTDVQSPGSISPSSVRFDPTTAQTSQYEQSGDVTKSLSDLSDLATTGGYSDANIADIRARDISPIRSIYANAKQDTERAKSLGGGYSPNFNAVSASMARDEANKIGDVTTAANAGIAQNVAANKLSAAPAYASASATANAAKTAADQRNADIINQINEANAQRSTQVGEFNSSNALDASKFNASTAAAINEANANRRLSASTGNADRSLDAQKFSRNNILGAIQGQSSLYGTTPALTKTFGDQVIQAGNLGQGQQQIDQQRRRDMLGFAGSVA